MVDTKKVKGIERSKYNAITHGLLKDSISLYEADSYKEIYEALVEEYEPRGITEYLLIQNASLAIVKNARVFRLEQTMRKSPVFEPDKPVSRFAIEPEYPYERKVINYEDVPVFNLNDKLDLIQRYQITNENRFYKAISALKSVQRERQLQKSVSQNGILG